MGNEDENNIGETSLFLCVDVAQHKAFCFTFIEIRRQQWLQLNSHSSDVTYFTVS